jgi:peroxiredoxin Q/BCP
MAKINNLPEFELRNNDGELVNILQLKGNSKLVLYFYPENESKICTKEACEFRDHYHNFLESGAIVVGINKASPAGLKLFKQKHSLPFTLLSDPDFKIHKLFGVKNILGFSGRETFLFDENGKLVYAYNSLLSASKHINNTLNMLKNEKGIVN